MASSEPTDDEIRLFLEFTTCNSRHAAVAFLKGNHGDVQRAVSEYYSDPNPQRFETSIKQGQYSESQWTAGKDGPSNWQTDTPPAFNFDDADDWQSMAPLGAPTRPSTPSQHTKQIEYSSQQEQEDIEKALEASMKDSWTVDQQSGIIDSTGNEVVPDTQTAADRKRHRGEPAFLKPLPRNSVLPSLFSILSNIPLFCATVFGLDQPSTDSAYNDHWWDGEPVTEPIILSGTTTEDISRPGDIAQESQQVIRESQRLLAFLRNTERSFGSAAVLDSLLSQSWKPSHIAFAKSIEVQARRSGTVGLNALLESRVVSNDPWKPSEAVYTIDVDQVKKVDNESTSLYDVIDQWLWSTDIAHNLRYPRSFESLASIITFTFDKPVEVSIEPVIYFDRYTSSATSVIEEMWRRKLALEAEHKRLDQSIQDHVRHTTVDGKNLEVQKLLEITSQFVDSRIKDRLGINSLGEIRRAHMERENSTNITNELFVSSESEVLQLTRLLSKLRTTMSNIDEDLKGLLTRRETIFKEIRENSRILTRFSEETMRRPHLSYHLRGCAINAKARVPTLYTLSRDTPTSSERWWKLEYDYTGSAAQICKHVVPEIEVLSALTGLQQPALLVYASQESLDSSKYSLGLPPSLDRFVALDNQTFQRELGISSSPAVFSTGENLLVEDKRMSNASTIVENSTDGSNLDDVQQARFDPSMKLPFDDGSKTADSQKVGAGILQGNDMRVDLSEDMEDDTLPTSFPPGKGG